MGFLSFLTNAQNNNDNLPWNGRASILEHISTSLDTNGKITEIGETLPDETTFYKDNDLRWVAGGGWMELSVIMEMQVV